MGQKRVFKHLTGVVTTAGTTQVSLNPPSGYLYSVIAATCSLTTGTGTGSRYSIIQGALMGNGTGEGAWGNDLVSTGSQTTTSSTYAASSSFWSTDNPSGGTSHTFSGPVIIWPTITVGTNQTGLFFQSVLISGDSAAYDLLVEVIPYAEG